MNLKKFVRHENKITIMCKANVRNHHANDKITIETQIRRLFMVCCLLIFGYQSFKICSEYYSYDTLITISNNRSPVLDLPGLTICFNLQQNSKYNTTSPWQFLTVSPNVSKDICYIWGPAIKNGTKTGKYLTLCEEISPIIISTVFKRGKCFTYFSQLNMPSIERKTINQMNWYSNVVIRLFSEQLHTFYGNTSRGINFFLHSPFMIPTDRFSDLIIVNQKKLVSVKYFSTITHFLKYPHKTNCTDYGVETHMKYASQAKCFQDCYTNERKRRCGCLTYDSYNDVHQLKDITPNDLFCTPKKESECGLEEQTIGLCQERCPMGCYDDQYTFSSTDTDFEKEPVIRIDIRHSKQSHDLSIEHKQSMNFFVFLANMGGIAGLWFGLNITTIYDQIIRFVKISIKRLMTI